MIKGFDGYDMKLLYSKTVRKSKCAANLDKIER